jgi:ABC-type Fe3+ transport system substrate-binding protein
MTAGRVLMALAFALILGVPFALRPAQERAAARDTPTLIIMTPHVAQIRREFGAGFDRWHTRKYGQHVQVDWRGPLGTSEIIKQLESQYSAALKAGRYELKWAAGKPAFIMAPGTIGLDMVFGGGTFDHGRLKSGVRTQVPGPDGKAVEISCPMSAPAGFDPAELDRLFGTNACGAQTLYDPDQYWIGVALSAFGIVYNRDMLKRLDLPEPRRFADLTDPRYFGYVALADPRQSGSISTSFDSILNNEGWDRGWRILRDLAANTRYFTYSSTKPPIDVSDGEAAAGLAIDFYGRGQSQAVMLPGQTPETSRVGYVDPTGSVYIDADPCSILRGCPHPELAKRFVEYCLSDEAQALWQFHTVSSPSGANNPIGEDGKAMGPHEYELRRAPVRRAMYEKYLPYFVDQVSPFTIASDVAPKGWRSSIALMMGCFAIDIAAEQRAAWAALNRARADQAFDKGKLAEMERLFYAWPQTEIDGKPVEFTAETCKAIIAQWKKPGVMPGAKIAYTEFFRENYKRIVHLSEP